MSTQEFADFEIDYDFNSTKPMEGGGFELVPEGTYRVQVINLQQKTASTGKSMVEVEFLITDEQPSEEAQGFAGSHLWNNYVVSDKAMGRFSQLMIACSAPLDKFRASAIYGQEILIDVVHNEGEQKTDAEGNPLPIRTFANVCRERALDDGQVQEEAPPPPPVTRAKPAVVAGTKPIAAAKSAAVPPPPARTPVRNGAATRRA